jgi:hypothetical protein
MQIRIIIKPARPTSDAVRRHEPLTFGIPLPREAARGAERWSLVGVDGGLVPVQTRVLEAWPGGSVRWMLVDAQSDLDLSMDGALVLTSSAGAHAPRPQREVSIVDERDGVVVDTGAARFGIRRGGAFPFDEVIIQDRAIIDPAANGLIVTDDSGAVCSTQIEQIVVEERGPLRSSVRIDGTIRGASGAKTLGLSARVDFFAGLPTVRLRVCLTNPKRARHRGGFWDLGDQGSVYVKDVSLVFALRSSGAPATVGCSPELGAPWEQFATPFELYQDSSGGENWKSPNHKNRRRQIPNSFRGYRLRSAGSARNGLRATPAVSVTQGTSQIAVTVPQWWENFPKAIDVDTSSLTLRLFPGQYADVHEIQGGEQKTHECFVSYAPDGVTAQPLEWCRARPFVCVDPDWCLRSEAVPFLAPMAEDHQSLVNAAIEGPDRFECKREVVDEYGWRHFGEIYGDHEAVRHVGPAPLVSHYNNQYDPMAGFAYRCLATADSRWWGMMSDLAGHVVDIDVYHTANDKSAYNHGLFWHTYHYGDADTATHRTHPRTAQGRTHGGGPSAGHNYTTGLMLHHFLTGDETSRQTVIDLAEYVIAIDDGRKTVLRWLDSGYTGLATMSASPDYHGPGRGPANSLNALVDGHRLTGETRFLEKAEQLIRRVIHPNEDIDRRHLDVPEQRWFYTMFLQSLGKYLQHKAERGEEDEMYGYARASLLHYARWMADHEYPYLDKPEKLEFPTETWAAQDIRKSDVFYFAAVHAAADERQRFVERGRFFFTESIGRLRRMPTRTLARPVIVVLTSGLLHSWWESHPAAPAPRTLASREFGAAEEFVPQKTRAKRRLKWIGGSGIVLLLVAAFLLVVSRWR